MDLDLAEELQRNPAIGANHNGFIQFTVVEKFYIELVSDLDLVIGLRGHGSVPLRFINGDRRVRGSGTGNQKND
jgi:hypothetical protein